MFAGVSECTREGNDLYREMIESGVIKLGNKLVTICSSMVLLCFGTCKPDCFAFSKWC